MKREPRCGHSWAIDVKLAADPSWGFNLETKREQGYLIHQEVRPHGTFWMGVMPAVTKEQIAHEEWIERLNEPVVGSPKIRELLSDETKWSPKHDVLDSEGKPLSRLDHENVHRRGVRWGVYGAISRCYGDRGKMNRQWATVCWRMQVATGKRPLPDFTYAEFKALVDQLDL